jgi:Ala-tRNA(Pro) deacylase
MRVPSFLADHQVPFETIVHQPAYTASKRARFLHVPGRDLAKCVLLTGPRNLLLAILPATHQIDLELTATQLGGPVRLASTEEMAEVFRDCEWGTLVPFGRLYGVPSLLDDSFDKEALLVFEAHQHAVAIRMRCRDFERLEKPKRLRLTRQSLSQSGHD